MSDIKIGIVLKPIVSIKLAKIEKIRRIMKSRFNFLGKNLVRFLRCVNNFT